MVIAAQSGQSDDLLQVRSTGTTGNLFVINGSGSVGIGTTTPQALLEINSSSNANLTLDAGGTDAAYITLRAGDGDEALMRQNGGNFQLSSSDTGVQINGNGYVQLLTGWPATILLLIASYLYGTWRLRKLGGPSVEEFKAGTEPPWEGQQRGF